MSYTDLLHNLNFDLDPFAKTNADEEELLKSYFIEPPFEGCARSMSAIAWLRPLTDGQGLDVPCFAHHTTP